MKRLLPRDTRSSIKETPLPGDCMSSQQLVDFIHEHINIESSLSAVCEKVLDRCLAPSTAGGEGCDNMTMILVQFKKPIDSKDTATEELAQVASEAENN